jgi:ribosomal protein L11 methyltransferase
MHLLHLQCPPTDKDSLIAELWERGTTGIVEGDSLAGECVLQAYFDDPFDAAAWARYGALWEAAQDRDWVAVAQSQWEPVLVGSRFYLAPSWREDATPPGRLRLEMQPGQACGTGWGPATQLALEAMERRLRPDSTVLDLGTGSGILAVAASLLGAGRIYACDIEFEAASAARRRFHDESIEVGLFTGSLRAVRSATVDLLIANINAETLTSLAPEVLRVLTPGGAAALTGFPERHLARVRAAFGDRGEVLERGEWRALIR